MTFESEILGLGCGGKDQHETLFQDSSLVIDCHNILGEKKQNANEA